MRTISSCIGTHSRLIVWRVCQTLTQRLSFDKALSSCAWRIVHNIGEDDDEGEGSDSPQGTDQWATADMGRGPSLASAGHSHPSHTSHRPSLPTILSDLAGRGNVPRPDPNVFFQALTPSVRLDILQTLLSMAAETIEQAAESYNDKTQTHNEAVVEAERDIERAKRAKAKARRHQLRLKRQKERQRRERDRLRRESRRMSSRPVRGEVETGVPVQEAAREAYLSESSESEDAPLDDWDHLHTLTDMVVPQAQPCYLGWWGRGERCREERDAAMGEGVDAAMGEGGDATMGVGADATMGEGADAAKGEGVDATMGEGADATMGEHDPSHVSHAHLSVHPEARVSDTVTETVTDRVTSRVTDTVSEAVTDTGSPGVEQFVFSGSLFQSSLSDAWHMSHEQRERERDSPDTDPAHWAPGDSVDRFRLSPLLLGDSSHCQYPFDIHADIVHSAGGTSATLVSPDTPDTSVPASTAQPAAAGGADKGICVYALVSPTPSVMGIIRQGVTRHMTGMFRSAAYGLLDSVSEDVLAHWQEPDSGDAASETDASDGYVYSESGSDQDATSSSGDSDSEGLVADLLEDSELFMDVEYEDTVYVKMKRGSIPRLTPRVLESALLQPVEGYAPVPRRRVERELRDDAAAAKVQAIKATRARDRRVRQRQREKGKADRERERQDKLRLASVAFEDAQERYQQYSSFVEEWERLGEAWLMWERRVDAILDSMSECCDLATHAATLVAKHSAAAQDMCRGHLPPFLHDEDILPDQIRELPRISCETLREQERENARLRRTHLMNLNRSPDAQEYGSRRVSRRLQHKRQEQRERQNVWVSLVEASTEVDRQDQLVRQERREEREREREMEEERHMMSREERLERRNARKVGEREMRLAQTDGPSSTVPIAGQVGPQDQAEQLSPHTPISPSAKRERPRPTSGHRVRRSWASPEPDDTGAGASRPGTLTRRDLLSLSPPPYAPVPFASCGFSHVSIIPDASLVPATGRGETLSGTAAQGGQRWIQAGESAVEASRPDWPLAGRVRGDPTEVSGIHDGRGKQGIGAGRPLYRLQQVQSGPFSSPANTIVYGQYGSRSAHGVGVPQRGRQGSPEVNRGQGGRVHASMPPTRTLSVSRPVHTAQAQRPVATDSGPRYGTRRVKKQVVRLDLVDVESPMFKRQISLKTGERDRAHTHSHPGSPPSDLYGAGYQPQDAGYVGSEEVATESGRRSMRSVRCLRVRRKDGGDGFDTGSNRDTGAGSVGYVYAHEPSAEPKP
ncbi:hypothetical protein KIPB_000426 [Kipferlia bialata]|uniref:Uncharacterized protein n=1 Tax=Kipferlia bialata TaxID=797122 RepID=A0A9K3CNR8_9EUKA|nr:hypothetical protein KIPB_000426 [Kipferlia bialata]|eukprot:g426.t1